MSADDSPDKNQHDVVNLEGHPEIRCPNEEGWKYCPHCGEEL